MMEPWLGRAAATTSTLSETIGSLQKNALRMLDRVELPPQVPARRITRSGDPRVALSAVAKRSGARLLVLGSRTSTGSIEKILLGSTAERVLRVSECPVLIVKSKVTSYKNILIAVDFSRISIEVVRTVLQLFPEASLTLGTVASIPREATLSKARKAEIELALRSIAREGGIKDDEIQVATAVGDPRYGIRDLCAAVRPELIAVGTHARRGFVRFLLGSVAEFVVRTSQVDVLAVPPAQKQ